MTIFIIIAAIFLIGTPIYMKFVLPKMMNKMNANHAEAEKEWSEKGDEIMNEFLSNPDKFGILKEALQGKELYGIINGKIPEKKGLWQRYKEHQKELMTLTREIDMTLGFLVAAEDGLHYMIFDGEKCVVNDVFDYKYIEDQSLTSDKYSFGYKEEALEFTTLEALTHFPRFNVHEVDTTGGDKSFGLKAKTTFIREWLAWENTNNSEYKTRVEMKPTLSGDFIQKKEFFIDQMIRTKLRDGFLEKLKVALEKKA